MNDSEFDQLLRDSGPTLETPAGFQRDVWLRIEAADSAGWKPTFERFIQPILDFITAPPMALAMCTVAIVIGAWIGLKTETPQSSGKVGYVQSISPFAHSHR